MRKLVGGLTAAAVAATVLGPPAAAREAARGKVHIRLALGGAARVTGGDVLLAVDVLRHSIPTRRFAGGSVGLVDGLRVGRNEVKAFDNGRRGSARSAPSYGSITIRSPDRCSPARTRRCSSAGRRIRPTRSARRSTPTARPPTRTEFFYRSTESGGFKPLVDPASRPADVAQTTTRSGDTVDYVVRVESGTINRAIYRLPCSRQAGGRPGPEPPARVRVRRRLRDRPSPGNAGPRCGRGRRGALAGLREGRRQPQHVQTACNEGLSAETTMMVKERIVESLRRVPLWTMGRGGSGGAIQQLSIGHNHPGLLDAIVPSLTFQDAQLGEPADCRLLNGYFNGPGPALTTAQQQAINGYRNIVSCLAWERAFADAIVADVGPGFARRTLDNVGVQYGLRALREGAITAERFLDLNDKIGRYDNDGKPRPERAMADRAALAIAYSTERINLGAGGLPRVPILDIRALQRLPADRHPHLHPLLRRAGAPAACQRHGRDPGDVARAGRRGRPHDDRGGELMARWLDALTADRFRRPRARKVIDAKPADAVDAGWPADGQRIDDPAAIGATGPCTQLYPPAGTPRMRAGQPLGSLAIKCRLRPVRPSDYGALTAAGGAASRRLPERGVRLPAPGRGAAAAAGNLAVVRGS